MPRIIRPDGILRRTARPLSRSLEAQLVRLCSRAAPYRIEALALETGAPDSLESLLDATSGRVDPESETGAGELRDATGALVGERIPVWSGASERTIWSGPDANALFRAWHDSHHILLGAGFDPAGELRVARHACASIEGTPERAVLWCETWGQVCYFERWHAFPDAQRAFVRDAVRFGLDVTVERGVYHAVR